MPLPPEMNKQDLSTSTNQKQGALLTEGLDRPANGTLQTVWTVGEDRDSEDRQGLAGSEETDDWRAAPKTKTVGEGLNLRTHGLTASPAARPLAPTISAATMDHDESGDEPLTTSLLLSPMSEGPEVIVDSLGNMTMETRMEKKYGIDLDMTLVSKVVQVASKLKKTTITVGGWQMEMWNAFRDETSTLRQDLGKLEEQVAKAEKGQAGSDKAGEFVL
ncbi:hypothetical protein F5876DRAFT_77630 [Lentinula aff. lateritia]|uniref:Uncharacterized protein n=1 Tax=Lentinula aff. lateritia TaxID=2804960 RepID=A0ACC1TXS7_9AGAR|nr:hypothetical protein F5876DRAFT_77630 [Lentinula aff. lateritia]